MNDKAQTFSQFAHDRYREIFCESAQLSDCYGFGNQSAATVSTTSMPPVTFESIERALRLMPKEEPKDIVLISELGTYHTLETATTVYNWCNGVGLPPMRPFGRWWLAISCKLQLITLKMYKIDASVFDWNSHMEVELMGWPKDANMSGRFGITT